MEIEINEVMLAHFFLGLVLCSYVVQLLFYFGYYSKLAFHKLKPAEGTLAPEVTIIIAARNEAENLRKNLPAIFNQQYANFQVVVVNDSSWDDSDEVLEEMKQQHPNLHVVKIKENEKFDGGKKLALTLGVKAAKYNRLLFTDADCAPSDPNWISSTVKQLQTGDEIVIGYSPVRKTSGALNHFIRFDSLFTAIQYLNFALKGMPYMAVGRNLSYTKDLFLATGGFKRHYLLQSGDDDLFVNENATPANVKVNLEPESFVVTQSKTTWKAFWKQKRRHLSTSRKYKFKHKVVLLLYPVSLFLIAIGSVFLFVLNQWVYLLIGLLFFRMIVQILIFRRSMNILGQKDLIWLVPLYDLMYVFFGMFIQVANSLTKQGKWKT